MSKELSILIWNIGYAGLGKESSFIIDAKGKGPLITHKNLVIKNLNGILETLKQYQTDIIMLQEVTKESIINRKINILKALKEKFTNYYFLYSSILNYNFILKINHGNVIMSKSENNSYETKELPSSNKPFQPKYNYMLSRYPLNNKELVIINIHFMAFDKKGKTRELQLNYIKEIANIEYLKDNYVIIGGDWNIELCDTKFKTNERYPFWLKTLSKDDLEILENNNFKLYIDNNIPTVRTLIKPFNKLNYQSIIDGYLCSNNIDVISTNTVDTNFEYTDHNPVLIKIKCKK